ncbi:MAG: hypothetical protein ABIH26_08000 [Candidatus Eisenbacteria bacterium]
MKTRTGKGTSAASLALLLLFLAGGCVSEESPTAPAAEAPTLPDTSYFSFDYNFFNSPSKDAIEASQLNFLNAAIRVAVIKTVTDIVITPPVAAFALALHTVPTRQPDGSWLWVYTHVYGTREAQIRLRGEPEGGGALWELRITALHLGLDNELWFEGETRSWGQEGFWQFYDFNKPGDPMVARIDWEHTLTSKYVSFTDLYTNPDDRISYREDGQDRSIDFSDASEGEEWFIRWDTETGAGSLMVSDYNNGEEACWDSDRNDIDCTPAL